MSNKEKNNNQGIIIASIVAIIVILGSWLATYYLLKDLGENDRGTFGDMFGSINALFSGLALAGIIITILLQRNELKLQRQELADTRQEFKNQNETLKIQRFENTFFNLLNIHHKIVSDIDFRYYKNKEKDEPFSNFSYIKKTSDDKEIVEIEGRDVFRYKYNRFKIAVEENPNNWPDIYLDEYNKSQTDFGHYFRNLYRMVKLVDNTDFFYDKESTSTEEIFKLKYTYTSILRAQLSDFELAWLFYNCLSANGNEKFKPLIEKYSLLKNLPDNLILDINNHKPLYFPLAYRPFDN